MYVLILTQLYAFAYTKTHTETLIFRGIKFTIETHNGFLMHIFKSIYFYMQINSATNKFNLTMMNSVNTHIHTYIYAYVHIQLLIYKHTYLIHVHKSIQYKWVQA